MPELFKSFNSFLNIILRKKNAVIVGPHRQLVGEFPEDVTFQRMYEYYHGWDQIKRSIDAEHQKFMGNGIRITSNNEEYDKFIKEWWEITNAGSKWSEFFLSTFITGNGIMERQYTDDGRIGNIEHIPMTTIYKIFRDSWGNELKLQQIVDGVFMDLDPAFYIHWVINNPDRLAFGKSEFHTLAAPRRVTQKVDPTSGQPLNPDRTMTSLLDAQAKLQNAEVEIKDKMSKPRIFASFPGMPQEQLAKLESELSDPNSDKYIWAFNKEASMQEANIQGQGKFADYQANVDSHIDLGTGFASKLITGGGGGIGSYAAAQSTVDVLDQRMMMLQSIASEMIKDFLLRPLAESWGFKDFDEMDVEIVFVPTVRRLTMEEVISLPDVAVAPEEKRVMFRDLQIPLDDVVFDKFIKKQQAQGMPTPDMPQGTEPQQEEENPKAQAQAMSGHGLTRQYILNKRHFNRNKNPDSTGDNASGRIPTPIRNRVSADFENVELVEAVLSNPSKFDKYVNELVDKKVSERLESPPNRDYKFTGADEPTDLYAVRPEQGKPNVTDREVEKRLLGKNKEKKTAMPYTPANTLTPDKESHPSMSYNAFTPSTAKPKTEAINLPSDKDLPTFNAKKKKRRRKG